MAESIVLHPEDLPEERGFMDKMKAMLKSRRFIVAAISVVAVVFHDMFNIELDTDQMTSIVTWITSAWIISDGMRST